MVTTICLLLPMMAIGVSEVAAGHLAVQLLQYEQGDSSCPSKEDFASKVTGLLEQSPFAETGQLQVMVAFGKDGDGVWGTLQLAKSQQPPRRFAGKDCASVAAAIALALAIAVDPLAVEAEISEVSPREKPAPPQVASVVVPTIPKENPVRWSVLAETALVFGATPQVGPLLALGVQAGGEDWSLGARFFSTEAATQTLHDSSDNGAITARLLGLGGVGCRELQRLSVCGTAIAAAIRARGLAPLSQRQTVHRLYVSLGGRLLWQAMAVGAVEVGVFVDAQAALLRTRLTVSEMTAWRSPGILLNGGLALFLPL